MCVRHTDGPPCRSMDILFCVMEIRRRDAQRAQRRADQHFRAVQAAAEQFSRGRAKNRSFISTLLLAVLVKLHYIPLTDFEKPHAKKNASWSRLSASWR